MARTIRSDRAFRAKPNGRITAPIARADFITFGANGRPYSKHGEEAWTRGSKRWAKRMAARARRRLDRAAANGEG